ncbi:MAG TPA: hypothetical protein VIY49_06335 [Bryobacteraceae bacterium]
MNRTVLTRLAYGFLFAVAAAIGWQLPSNPSAPPAPFATPVVKNYPEVVARPASGQLHSPSGFRIEEWAKGFSTHAICFKAEKVKSSWPIAAAGTREAPRA